MLPVKIYTNTVKIFLPFICCMVFTSCDNKNNAPGSSNNKEQVDAMLDSFNIAAAKADFNSYFNFYTDDAIFTGTDATERWNKKQFMAYAKPYFDKGHAWNFKSIGRHIYFDKTGTLAWFDELLSTQMKICRGSGVVSKEGNAWKVRQYILSATIPNEQMDSIAKHKGAIEDSIIINYQTKNKNDHLENE